MTVVVAEAYVLELLSHEFESFRVLYRFSSFICFSTDIFRTLLCFLFFNIFLFVVSSFVSFKCIIFDETNALSWKHTWLTSTKIHLSNINFLMLQEYRIVSLKIGTGSPRSIEERCISVASCLLDDSRPACKTLTNPTEFCSLFIRLFARWKKRVSQDRQ